MQKFSEYVNEGMKLEVFELNSLSYDEEVISYNKTKSAQMFKIIKNSKSAETSDMIKSLLEMAEKGINRDLILKKNKKVICLAYNAKTKIFSQRKNQFFINKKPKEYSGQTFEAKDMLDLLASL